ncbi:MAG: hypothetical protein AAGB32_02655 [Pseudomonadota bacterium]
MPRTPRQKRALAALRKTPEFRDAIRNRDSRALSEMFTKAGIKRKQPSRLNVSPSVLQISDTQTSRPDGSSEGWQYVSVGAALGAFMYS